MKTYDGLIPQEPDKHGVVAHTPDPDGYYEYNGAVIIPRHLPGSHGSPKKLDDNPEIRIVNPDNLLVPVVTTMSKVQNNSATKSNTKKATKSRAKSPEPAQEPIYSVETKNDALTISKENLLQKLVDYFDEKNNLEEVLTGLEEADNSESNEQIINEFLEKIGLKYITYTPSRPRVQVYFDLGKAGKLCAWYHDVTILNRCVVLTYDNRYEGGAQFIPPDSDSVPMKLSIPSKNLSLNVFSADLKIVDGPLDRVVLIAEVSGAEQLGPVS